MAVGPTPTNNPGARNNQPGGDGGFVKFASVAGVIVGILVGVNALTGVNPLKDILVEDATPATTPPLTEVWTPPEAPVSPPVVVVTPVLPPPATPATPEPVQSPPFFVVESQQWDGPCGGGCRMTAIFRNTGGDGSATAVFDVSSKAGEYLVSCSVVLPYTREGQATSAGCNAYNGRLQNFFRSNPDGRVSMDVTVNNS
jgi:hypothetical protein